MAVSRSKTVIILMVLFLLGLTGGCNWYTREKSTPSANAEPSSLENTSKKSIVNILVLGVDQRADDVGRSDTTFVVTVDTNAKKAVLLSIPRDTRVKIKGHGWDKINHAYAFGGKALSKQTVENLLGLPIDYTMTVNFSGFVKAVNALGGIDLNVDKRMYYSDPYDDNGGLLVDLKPGMQHLDGKQAIEYVRYRDEAGDIGRVARQQKFLTAVFSKMGSPEVIPQLPELIKALRLSLQSDIPVSKMLQIAAIMKDAGENGLQTEMVKGTPVYIQDISYWLPDIANVRTQVAAMTATPIDKQYDAATAKEVRAYAKALPKHIKLSL